MGLTAALEAELGLAPAGDVVAAVCQFDDELHEERELESFTNARRDITHCTARAPSPILGLR